MLTIFRVHRQLEIEAIRGLLEEQKICACWKLDMQRGVAQSLASVLQASVNNDVVLQQNGRHKLNTLSLIVMAALR